MQLITRWRSVTSSPFLPGAGVLRVPADGFGARHRDAEKNVVRHALVGPDMASARVPVVDESLFHLHRPIREEGEEIARSVSGIFLLPTFGVADPPVLTILLNETNRLYDFPILSFPLEVVQPY